MLQFTPEQLMIKQAAKDFAQTELKPGVIERDELQKFPAEQIKKLGELGFLGMMVSPEYHGAGFDTISYISAIEEISKVDASTAVIMSVNNSLICYGIEKFGTESQKEKYLKRLATGEVLGAFCLSEPEAGSDAQAQSTRVTDHGDYFLLNGTKNWITNGNSASIYLVIAKAGPGDSDMNALIVEREMDGFSVGQKENKMGVRGSDTHSVMFSDVRVPKENLLGSEGSGFEFAMRVLEAGRIGIAAQALGIAAGAYELALAYSKDRKAFGKPIADHQAIRFKLAEMATDIEAARLLCLKAAWLKDQNLPFATASSKAKLFASQVAMKTTIEAVQIHGGYGYVKEYHVERMMRDAKVTQIYEGTSEIQKLIISRNLLR